MIIPPVISPTNTPISSQARALKKSEAPQNTSFKGGIREGIVEGLAQKIAQFSKTKISDQTIKGLARYERPATVLSHLSSVAVTFFYLQNTAKSKKIPEERKPSLMINTVALTAVSSAIVPLVDKMTDKLVRSLSAAYKEVNPGLAEQAYDSFTKTTDKMKSLFVFTFIVRYAVPVLMVPVTGAIVRMYNKNKEEKAAKAENAANNTGQTGQQAGINNTGSAGLPILVQNTNSK